MKTDNKYRNTSRQEADELKLQELLKQPEAPEIKETGFVEPETTNTEPVLTPEEETWKKRYGDLRSFSQKELDAKEKELKDLKQKIAEDARKQYAPPKTREEVQDWATQFPEVYGMVRTVAYEEVQEELNNLKQMVAELKGNISEKDQKMAQREAYNQLLKLHPDWTEIKAQASFKEWLAKQSKLIQDALINSWDPEAAAAVIDLYKSKHQTKEAPKTPSVDTRREAATTIRPGNNSINPGSPEVWSESKFASLNRRDKERVMPEVEKAIAEGRFIYDRSGAAR